jgi:hypothetical protein
MHHVPLGFVAMSDENSLIRFVFASACGTSLEGKERVGRAVSIPSLK